MAGYLKTMRNNNHESLFILKNDSLSFIEHLKDYYLQKHETVSSRTKFEAEADVLYLYALRTDVKANMLATCDRLREIFQVNPTKGIMAEISRLTHP